MISDEELKAITSAAGMGALGAAVRCILDNQRSLTVYVTTFILCVFAALMAGYAADGMGISGGYKSMMIGSASVAAREVIWGIIKTASMVMDNAPIAAKAIMTRREKL